MDARTGRKIASGRLFHPVSGRAVVVALSHGVLLGPSAGMESLAQLRATAEALRDAEALMVAPGLVASLEDAFVGRDRPALIVHADWQSASRSVFRGDVNGSSTNVAAATTATASEAAAAGAIAVMTFLYGGFTDPSLERYEIERNAAMSRGCERAGILHIVEPRSVRERERPQDRSDPAIAAYLARIASEIGANVVKATYPGSREALEAVVESCTVPVLLAGGAEAEQPDRGEELAAEAVATGCRGIVFGRAIVRAADPGAALDRYRALVHAS